METTSLILTGLISLLFGGVLGGYFKSLWEYQRELTKLIWEKRKDAYDRLWPKMEILPKWPENKNLTYGELYDTCYEIKNWYFSKDGMLLSTKSKKAYNKVQEELFKIAKEDSKDSVQEGHYKILANLFKKLRDKMTEDLTSRKGKLYS